MPPRGEDKQQRILEAAITLFARHGFRKTSVDQLASEAGVAKPTLYAYFQDKDAIFTAVVQTVCDRMLADAEAAGESEAPLVERLAAMLAAKHTRYWELVHASPHAAELLDSQTSLAGEQVQRFDKAFLKILARTLEHTDELDLRGAGLSVNAAAGLLLRAAAGAGYDATSASMHARSLGEIVRVLVRGMSR